MYKYFNKIEKNIDLKYKDELITGPDGDLNENVVIYFN